MQISLSGVKSYLWYWLSSWDGPWSTCFKAVEGGGKKLLLSLLDLDGLQLELIPMPEWPSLWWPALNPITCFYSCLFYQTVSVKTGTICMFIDLPCTYAQCLAHSRCSVKVGGLPEAGHMSCLRELLCKVRAERRQSCCRPDQPVAGIAVQGARPLGDPTTPTHFLTGEIHSCCLVCRAQPMAQMESAN